MPEKPDLLRAEDAVSGLLTELERLKSATDEIDAVKAHSQTVVGAAQDVVAQSGQLAVLGQAVLRSVEDLRLVDRLNEVDRRMAEAAESQEAILQLGRLTSAQVHGIRKVLIGLVALAAVEAIALGILLALGF